MKNYFKFKRKFLVDWICIANPIQMGTLYILLGGFSGIVGMVLSMAIRFELAHEGGLIFKGSHTALALFFTFVIITYCKWAVALLIDVRARTFSTSTTLNFCLFMWSFYLLTSSLFLYAVGTGTLHPLLGSIGTCTGASVDLVILSMHLAGASSIMGVTNIMAICLQAFSAGTSLIRGLLFVKQLLAVLISSVFFVRPLHDPLRFGRDDLRAVKYVIPPGLGIFIAGYLGGKVLDFTPVVYETYRTNAAIRNSQTPAERAAYQAEIIARRVVEEPPSPTEGIRAEQKSSAFADWVMSSPDFGSLVGLFVFLIFLVALLVSLRRLYIARQLRAKGNACSKKLTAARISTPDAISIGFLTAAISFPLGRLVQDTARVLVNSPAASTDFFGYGPVIYDLLASDTFFSMFTIGCTAGVALLVWYWERPSRTNY